ncbi:hypothetical protein P4050_15850 [Pseudomonas aeruginosa]|nr:hypothetical protein [Pseudomonas aeruginosa]
MATFPGFQVPKPVEGIVAGITPNIDALELNQDISLAAVAASTWGGAYGAHQPVEVIHSTYQAVHQSALEENYYNRLWLIPTAMELGNVVSTQIRPASVWNAYFSPRTLTAIDREAADGITLSGQASPPLGFAAWRNAPGPSALARTARPSSMRGSSGDPGRAEPGPGHHWQSHHRLDVRTGLGRQHRRTPERIDKYPAKRIGRDPAPSQQPGAAPRVRREHAAAVDRERQLLDMTLFGWGARIWALPIWPDIQLLHQPLAAGSLGIPCDTAGLDFRDGGLAMLRGEDALRLRSSRSRR